MEIAQAVGVTGAAVRKDLAWVSATGPDRDTRVGHAGVGYDCALLMDRIRGIIGTNRPWTAVLVGCGNIGRALLAYGGFVGQGFEIAAVFDGQKGVVGRVVGRLTVQPMSELRKSVRSTKATIGIIAVPRSAAQTVATQLCNAGVRGILNFAPMRLAVSEGVAVTNIDVNVALEQLALNISLRADGKRPPRETGGAL